MLTWYGVKPERKSVQFDICNGNTNNINVSIVGQSTNQMVKLGQNIIDIL